MRKLYKRLAHYGFMNIFKRLFAEKKIKKILSEEEKEKKIDSSVNDAILDAIELNKDLEKQARKNFKLLQLEQQRKQILRNMGMESEESEEEDEEDEDGEEMKESFKNLILNSINKPKQAQREPNTFPDNDLDDNFGKSVKTNDSPIEKAFDKIRALPMEKQKQLLDLAGNYL